MSFFVDLFGRIFRKGSQQEGGDYPVLGLTGKPLNPLYTPRPRRDAFDKADKELDTWMRSMGYRKYRTAEQGLPRPKRRSTKKSKQMEPGEHKTMARIRKIKN